MVQVTQDLRGKNPLELAQYADDVVSNMTGNPNFSTPIPALAEISAQSAAIRAGQTRVANAETNLSTERATVRADAEALKALLTNEGTYIQGVANAGGNSDAQATAIAKSGGMNVKSSGTPASLLPAPQELSLTQGDETGEVDAHCHSVKGTDFYGWETCLDPDPNTGNWTLVTPTTKSQTTLKSLASGAIV